jgi:prepilin-type N-terminal cleavage/methylation domain-containing protein
MKGTAMRPPSGEASARGFSLLELLIATVIFLLILGAVFDALILAQQRYQSESQYLEAFQAARSAIDQIGRDVHSAGYPPGDTFTALAAAGNPQLVATPFAWSPGYSAAPCALGATCAAPGDFDLIIETNPALQSGSGIEWIRYELAGTTLYRGVASKTAGAGPAAATQANLVPYVENVMNNPPAAQMAQLEQAYPSMFPGNAPVKLFTYSCDGSSGPVDCSSVAPPNNTPPYIRTVNVTLIVMAPAPDPRTGQPRLATLTGQFRRMNPGP